MKSHIIILAFVLTASFIANAADTFTINGISTGQSVDSAKKNIPNLQCAASCVANNLTFYGSQGRFWASLKFGKIDELAFRFSPVIDSDKAKIIVGEIEKKYGQPQSNLGLKGCNEWAIDGGFLAVCLTPEISHVMWSHSSRVGMNERRPPK